MFLLYALLGEKQNISCCTPNIHDSRRTNCVFSAKFSQVLVCFHVKHNLCPSSYWCFGIGFFFFFDRCKYAKCVKQCQNEFGQLLHAQSILGTCARIDSAFCKCKWSENISLLGYFSLCKLWKLISVVQRKLLGYKNRFQLAQAAIVYNLSLRNQFSQLMQGRQACKNLVRKRRERCILFLLFWSSGILSRHACRYILQVILR